MTEQTAAPTRLSPCNDVVFKLLFGRNLDLLIGLLTAVLNPPSPIQKARVLNPELPKGSVSDKGTVLDIYVKFEDGTHIDVEMQAQSHDSLPERWLYYWARLYCTQLDAGTDYCHLSRCIGVFFLNFTVPESSKFHSIFEVLETTSGRRFSPALQLHTIELPRLLSIRTASPSEEQYLSAWSDFLLGTPHDKKARHMSNALIEKAERKLTELSADPAVRRLALDRERDQLAYHATLAHELSRGRAEGKAEGKATERLELLRRILMARPEPCPPEYLRRLEDSSPERLLTWFEAALANKSFDDIFES